MLLLSRLTYHILEVALWHVQYSEVSHRSCGQNNKKIKIINKYIFLIGNVDNIIIINGKYICLVC